MPDNAQLPARHFSLESSPTFPTRFQHDPSPVQSCEISSVRPLVVKPVLQGENDVVRLLEQHGMQDFANTLLVNGFDNIEFLREVSDEDLRLIGIENNSDREKLRKLFANI